MSRGDTLARGVRTHVVAERSGWVWARPRPWLVRGAGAVVAVPTVLVAALLAAVVPELPTAIALGLIALLLVAAAIGGLAAWRFGQTRVGVSPIGLAVQRGAAPSQIAWRSVERVRASAATGDAPVRLAIVHDDGETSVPLALEPDVAAAWLERAASLAPPGVRIDRVNVRS